MIAVKVNGYNDSCGNGVVSTKNVTIIENPAVTNNPLASSICSNNNAGVTLTATVPGTLLQWVPTCIFPLIAGYASGSGTTIPDFLVNTGTTPGFVDYKIIPWANGCTGDTVHYILTVVPLPVLTTNPLTLSICSNQATNIVLSANVPGTTFIWAAAGSSGNVTGYAPGAGSLIQQTLINSGFVDETVTYTITSSANGCDGIPVNFIVTVYPVPDVLFTPASPSICSGQTTNIALTSMFPAPPIPGRPVPVHRR